jgi:hypothetical protein
MSSVVGAAAGLLTSLTIALQSDEYRCKSMQVDAAVCLISLGAFAAVNFSGLPALQNSIELLNQVVVVLPPVLNTVNSQLICKPAGPALTSINMGALFLNIALPLVVYQVVSNDKFRAMTSAIYPGASSRPMYGPYKAQGTSRDVAMAKKRALDALHRAMRS